MHFSATRVEPCAQFTANVKGGHASYVVKLETYTNIGRADSVAGSNCTASQKSVPLDYPLVRGQWMQRLGECWANAMNIGLWVE